MKYRYHRIGKHLACLDQSIYDVVMTVRFGHDRNQLSSIGVSRSVGRRAIKVVTQSKLRLLNSDNQVLLPVFGHIAMQVHRGYKVFDFNRLEVSKVFGQEVSTRYARKEVAASRRAAEIAAAPRHLLADPDLAWFKEEYICGVHATDIVSGLDSEYVKFYPDVEACLLDLVASESPRSVAMSFHIKRLADTSFRTRWLSGGMVAGEINEISRYLQQLRQWLESRSDADQLQLVPAHGDFSLVNAIATDAGLRFIDWEGIAPGGLYSDILNFLFVERYYGRAAGNFSEQISVFVNRYRKSILSRFPQLERAAAMDPAIARRLYYLERLKILLDRSVSANLCDVVCKTIAMFRKFDDETGDVAV